MLQTNFVTLKKFVWHNHKETSLLRRLQAHTLPNEAPPIGKIHGFSKMAVTFEPLMGFGCPLGFKEFLITMT